MKLVIEYDDTHWNTQVDCLNFFESMIKEFPAIKVTMFTVAAYNFAPMNENINWTRRVKKLIDQGNLELGLHGFYHTQEEFKHLSLDQTHARYQDIVNEFREAGLPFVKLFRGPHWGINAHTYCLARDEGLTIFSHEDYIDLAVSFPTVKTIYYNWNLKDAMPTDKELLIAHGHTHNVCSNGIEESYNRLKVGLQAAKENVFASEIC